MSKGVKIFGHCCLYYVCRQEVKWERKRGMGSGKCCELGLELRTHQAQRRYILVQFSVHQESPRSDIFRTTKPLLKQKHRQKHLTWAKEKKNWIVAQWSKVLFSDSSKFSISFGNQGLESGGRVERHRIHVARSPVWILHSQWWFGLHVICWCWSTVFSEVQSTHPSTRKC